MNEKIHAPTQKLSSPVTAIDLHSGRPVAGAPGGAGCPAAGLPCLLVTSATKSHGRRSQIFQCAEHAEELLIDAEAIPYPSHWLIFRRTDRHVK
jgi:hypothetical protein